MSIRPVDLQTLFPKIPEVQKTRNMESELEKSNLNINIHKEQQQLEKNTKQVVETKKTEGSKVTRDGSRKDKRNKQGSERKNGHDENHTEKGNEAVVKSSGKIDIRI
jgi:hypothetical protein